MKILIRFVLLISVGINSQYLFSQNLNENQSTKTPSNFQNYIDFKVKLVDFENSLYINDFKTTEFQIENGFTYLRRVFTTNSVGNRPFTSSVRYHSVGLNISYSF